MLGWVARGRFLVETDLSTLGVVVGYSRTYERLSVMPSDRCPISGSSIG